MNLLDFNNQQLIFKTMKTIKNNTAMVVLLFAIFLLSGCATMKPKSKPLRHAVRVAQNEIQYEHSTASLNDKMRNWRNRWQRPYKMTRIPLTQVYIY